MKSNIDIIIFIVIAVVLTGVVLVVVYPLLKNLLFKDSFADFNGSGYGLNHQFGKLNTIVPLNLVSKSTDFKLLSLMSQIKFSYVKPPSTFDITKTPKGILELPGKKGPYKNVILFPGNADYKLMQKGMEVWPKNIHKLDNTKEAIVFENNEGHMNPIVTLLENLDYKEGYNLNTLRYDFRRINLDKIMEQMKTYLNTDTVIIAYDFGAVIANICINYLKELDKKEGTNFYNNIDKFILICPTIGGLPMTIRDYFSGGVVPQELIENYHSILLSMPSEKFYDKPVAILDSISYNAKPNNISKLLNDKNKPVELYNNLLRLQHFSFENPGVNCIIVANGQYSTPVCYNFKDDLSTSPERYYAVNNNQFPNDDIHNNGTYEGLQAQGDKVVPLTSIEKLMGMWSENSTIELIRDKDHFTILKSYELALIIMSNL
jgi:hypothetical protein